MPKTAKKAAGSVNAGTTNGAGSPPPGGIGPGKITDPKLIAQQVGDQIALTLNLLNDYANSLQARGEATLAAMVRRQAQSTKEIVGPYLNTQIRTADEAGEKPNAR